MKYIKNLIPASFVRRLQSIYYDRAKLGFTLVSGVRIQVRSHVDWCLYNDIFVEGEYDRPIDNLIEATRRKDSIRILDLGSNVGFFVLRILDRLGAKGLRKPIFVGAIEPDPLNIADMQRRLECQDPAIRKLLDIRIVRGLAGKREGSAVFQQTHSYHAGSISHEAEGKSSNGAALNYIDVASTFGPEPWDMIKCDIEGSELDFVTNYPDLLERAEMFVVEVHHDVCSLSEIRPELERSGLTYRAELTHRESNSVHLFSK